MRLSIAYFLGKVRKKAVIEHVISNILSAFGKKLKKKLCNHFWYLFGIGWGERLYERNLMKNVMEV
jgi:hypothetical protein